MLSGDLFTMKVATFSASPSPISVAFNCHDFCKIVNTKIFYIFILKKSGLFILKFTNLFFRVTNILDTTQQHIIVPTMTHLSVKKILT